MSRNLTHLSEGEYGHLLSTNNKLLGYIFSKEKEADLAAGQQAAPQRDAKNHKMQRAEGNQARGGPKEEDMKRHRKF